MMKKNGIIYWIIGIILLFIIVLGIVIVTRGNKKIEISNSDLFREYIQSYSSNVISKNDVIHVQFTESFINSVKEKKTGIFITYPNVKGSVTWKENNILEFKPEKALESGKQYLFAVDLRKLSNDVPKELGLFTFSVNTKYQTLKVMVDALPTTDRVTFEKQNVSGKIKINDPESPESILKCLSANIDEKNVDIVIEKNNDLEYTFTIFDINRDNHEQILHITYDGKAIGAKNNGEIYFPIPPVEEFKVIEIQTYQSPEQYINIIFSDPIEEQQLLDGIITLTDVDNLKFIIVDNNIKIIPPERLENSYTINIHNSIKNVHGKELGEKVFKNINFEMRKPELLLKNNGVILPSNEQGKVISFDAVNIKAVDVRISKIFENNILQFLQNNTLSGTYNLNNVGRVIKTKTIDLRQTDVVDFGKWNTFYLSLNDIIKTEPGAIYRIEIGFRKENVIFPCEDSNNYDNEVIYLDDNNNWQWFTNYTYYNYDSYDSYYYDYYDDYDYYDNDDYESPCSKNYYGYKKAVKFNILASDIGLIGKIGKDNKIYAFVSNLSTTDAVSGAKVDIYDFQQQLIGSSVTNNEGNAIIEFDKKDKPYFMVASYNSQKSYIKLDDSRVLNTSEFNVSGEYIQDGTNAYIYTERGVWRPGDSIYVGFIINETMTPIPVGHPIVFEVRNPRNQEVYREVQGLNNKGFHVFKFRTDQNDPTGYYNAKFTIGGKIFTKSLMVETIKPNRFNINLDIDKDYITGDGSVNALVNVKWLHGGAAVDVETDIAISLSQMYSPFKKYENYNFVNQYANFNFTTTTLFNGKTNENGEIRFPVRFDKIKSAPGVLQATLTTKAFEKGGNFSISEKSVIYHPYDTYIGMEIPELKKRYNLPLHEKINLNIIAIDKDQKLLQSERDVEISVYYIRSSWWYDYQDDKVDFITANYNNALSREIIKCVGGKVSTNIEFEDYGSYLIVAKDIKGGHISSQSVYASSYSSGKSSEKEAVDILKFSTEKELYNVGEIVDVTIPTGNGKALVSIENSGKILNTFWKKSENNNISFSFKATPEMAPNVYVNVIFIQAHGSSNDRPIRMYGIIPVMVEDPETHLKPVITMDNELLAESKVKIKVNEEKGKPMSYTLAIVDEGLLNLTKFPTPDPWSHFFRKEALGVKTWDIYNQVIGAFTVDAGKMLSIGGGFSDVSPEDMQQALRFKPMVKFLGPFYLEPGKSQTHEIQLPQYIGSVRTMVVAANNKSFGSAEKSTPVKKPLMILGTAPRSLGTQESFKLPVTVFTMKPEIKNVNISVKTNDLLKINGASNKDLIFHKEGEQYLNFDLVTTKKTGIATIEITATSGNQVSKYNIELDVHHVNSKVTDVLEGVMNGNSYNIEFDALGIEGTNEAVLEIYSIPPMNLESRLDYLISYPHGCIEQITSAAFPQIYLSALMDLTEKQKSDIQRNVNACLNRLIKYQVPNGGFAYWPGNSNVSEWGTNYAGHFMLEAEKAGFTIPGNIKNNWLKYQKDKASKWIDDGSYSQLDQAYRLYTLALAGQPDRSAMNRLKETKTSNITIWRLASAFSLSGKESIAKSMISGLSTSVSNYMELSGTFGSTIRDKAFILETFTEIGDKENAFKMVREISEILGSRQYCNTQAIAYSLLAVSKFINKYSFSENTNCSYMINNKEHSVQTTKPVFKANLEISEKGKNKLTIKSNENSMLYIRIVRKGIPEIGYETAAQSNIYMTVDYTYLDGKPINISNIPQGTDFIATVTLKNISPIYYYLENVALTQIFPSGWEIINSRMFSVELGEESYYTYQDIRDDRVMTYMDMDRNHVYTYRVMLNASYEGKYYLPPTTCETMYDDSNYSRTKGLWVEVKSN